MMIRTILQFNASNSLTAAEMREVDGVAVAEFGLEVVQLMEVAAFQMARLVRRLEEGVKGKRVLVLAGKGSNGGDAIACARYLHNWGAQVELVAPLEKTPEAEHHFLLAKKLDISIPKPGEVFYHSDVVIDGLLGYSIRGDVRPPYQDQIEQVNGENGRVYSFDIPSGLDPDDGSVHGVAMKADVTLTLAYPKRGLFMGEAEEYVGELYLGDIGIPDEVYKKVGEKFADMRYENPFESSSIIKIN